MTELSGIPPFLDRRTPATGRTNAIPPATFSNLNVYDDICPFQYYRKFVVKDIPYVENEAQKKGNDAHRALELRVGRGVPLPAHWEFAEALAAPLDGKGARTELKLGMTIQGKATGHFDSDVAIRGRIDVAIVAGENGYLVDWKTSKTAREDPFELEVQGLLLKAAYPQLTSVKSKFVWLTERRYGATHDVSDFRRTWARVTGIMQRIQADKTWEKTPNGLCKAYCDVFDCQHNGRRK